MGGGGAIFFLSGVHSRGNMKGKVSGKVFLNERRIIFEKGSIHREI